MTIAKLSGMLPNYSFQNKETESQNLGSPIIVLTINCIKESCGTQNWGNATVCKLRIK